MIYEEESDYIMRMIKEAARVLFSLIFGKKYTQIELLQIPVDWCVHSRISGAPILK